MAASLSESDESVNILSKKNARTGVLRSNKTHKKAHHHHIIQPYFVLWNKSSMPKWKYMSHIAEDCTGVRTNRTINNVTKGSMGSSTDNVKQYKNSEQN